MFSLCKDLDTPAYTDNVRTIVLTLALVTSPLGAAVCEVVCADHVAGDPILAPN